MLETLPKQNQNKNLILPELRQNTSSKFAWMRKKILIVWAKKDGRHEL